MKETFLWKFGFKMNINIFFVFISSVLLSILFLFKPLELQQKNHNSIALFNLSVFTIYEFDENGLLSVLNGEEGIRYKDRYEIQDVDYTDNSQEFVANIQSDYGVYKNEVINLNANVVYIREDGVTFESQEAVYNTKTSVVRVDKDFIIYKNKNIIRGILLVYNNKLDIMKFNNVRAIYQIDEG
jgi:LPS export ABC transporter protein LptC